MFLNHIYKVFTKKIQTNIKKLEEKNSMVPIFTFCLMRNNLGKWLLFVFSIVQSNSTQNFDSATLSYLLHFEPMVFVPSKVGYLYYD